MDYRNFLQLLTGEFPRARVACDGRDPTHDYALFGATQHLDPVPRGAVCRQPTKQQRASLYI